MNSRALLKSMLVPIVAVAVVGYVGWSYLSGSCPLCRLGAALTPSTPDEPLPPSAERAAPPAFSATTLDGRRVSLDTYKGKVVLLDFWATWCGPCVVEVPNVKAAYNRFHAQGFEVLGISLDENREALKSFVARKEMPWPQVFNADADRGSDPASLYGVRGIPYTVLVGKDGKIVAMDLRGDHLAAAVDRALK